MHDLDLLPYSACIWAMFSLSAELEKGKFQNQFIRFIIDQQIYWIAADYVLKILLLLTQFSKNCKLMF